MDTIPFYEAYLFNENLNGGTTRPWQILVDTGKDLPELYVLKLFTSKDLKEENYIAHEVMGGILAEEFDLHAPPFALIDVGPSFLASVPPPQIVDFKKCPPGPFFGSAYVGGGEYSDALHYRYLTKDDIPTILAFDMLIYNTDRNTRKPNLLIKDQQFYLIDHEKAFGLDNPHVNQLSYQIRQHLLFKHARKLFRKEGDSIFDSFTFYLQAMNFNRLASALNQLEKLGLAGSKQQTWLRYLKDIQKKPDKFLNLLKQHLK